MISRREIENEAELLKRLEELANPTGGDHTPTPWKKSEPNNIVDGNGKLVAHFLRAEDRDFALYFCNAHAGMIGLFNSLAGAFEFIAAGTEPEDKSLREFAQERAETTRIYVDLFCNMGRMWPRIE